MSNATPITVRAAVRRTQLQAADNASRALRARRANARKRGYNGPLTRAEASKRQPIPVSVRKGTTR